MMTLNMGPIPLPIGLFTENRGILDIIDFAII